MRSITTILIVMMGLFVAACTEDEENSLELGGFDEERLIEQRQAKDKDFAESDDSPIPAHVRSSFTGLRYYKPDETFAVEASFEGFSKQDTITMETSTNEPRFAVRVGRFTFDIKGRTNHLVAYRFVGGDAQELFVPFKDKTSGDETYGGGRYMDLHLDDDTSYTIDFNQAYNPYCAYNGNYSCPLVPDENKLAVAITAGERTWK